MRARALADPVGFFDDNPAPLILDEIQYAPELLHYIKDRIDEHRVPGQWLLTGSQTFSLMEGVSQTMSGRVAVLTLDPLSVAEARKDSKIGTFDALLRKVFRPAATKARFEKNREHLRRSNFGFQAWAD